MGTDNFIPPPLAPSPFLPFFIWLFISCPPASQQASKPASHLLSVCAESALSSLALGFRVGELFLKAALELYSEEMLLPTGNPKDMGLWQWVCICVWGDSIRMGVFMAHCTGTAAPFTHTLAHTRRLLSHQHSWCPLLLFSLPSSPSSYAYHFITLSAASAVAGTQGETLPLLSHVISLAAALMCAVPYSDREKKKNLVVTASETDWLQRSINPLSGPAPLQSEADRSPLFPFLPFLSFFSGRSNI